MKPLPLPVRVAVGLAVTAVDRARHLPEKLAELPVTMVSQALQLSMRLQQQMTELAIKGDDALSTFRPVEESPELATFDEDASQYDASKGRNGTRSRFDATDLDDADTRTTVETTPTDDPWTAEESGILHELDNEADEPPTALPTYDDLTLPQLRARLRRLTIDELTELVDYERAHQDRPEFVGMLTRRIGTLRDQR
ncbi:MAG TPA: lipid droplet-associated protein [Pseudonocardiaceae bacterium]|nr:lipid droplet-associated protein [Pseudonocardiaceae bacterium]